MKIATFQDYLSALKGGTIFPIARLEFLDQAGLPDFEITSAFFNDGQLSCNKQNGMRRTATISLSNTDGAHNVNINKIWTGQQVKVSAGIRLPNGEDFLLPQGVFLINNPEETLQPSSKVMRLNLVDKWGGLDGTVGGKLDGIYQINAGDDLLNAVEQTLSLDRGNGMPLDSSPPVLDNSFLDKTAIVTDAYGNSKTIPFTQAPYTLRTEAEQTYADVLLGINTMLVASCGYDNTGHFRMSSANTEIDDSRKPIAWNFSVKEREFYGAQTTYDFSSVCNDIRIIGATVGGIQVSGRATNTNPASNCNVARIGYRTFTETQSKYYTYEQCNELARYYLRQKTIVQQQVTFTTTPIYHLSEDMLISMLRPEISDIPELYLVTGFSLPLGGLGPMTINAVSVGDLDIYNNWNTSYKLSVFASQFDALTYEYQDDSILPLSRSTALTNPYDIIEVPEGAFVTFTVNIDPSSSSYGYTISSALLNGVALDHDGQSCSFNMPRYNSRLVFILTAISGDDLDYTYTGASTSSSVTDGSRAWKVIKFTSSGVLTINPDQIEEGISADIWARGAGGGASAAAGAVHGYDISEADVVLDTSVVTITVGSGGIYGADRGRAGSSSSWGTRLNAPGGAGAGSVVSNLGGKLEKIFGLIEDVSTGQGGSIGNAGNDGAVWLRIAT